jgi:hypothetical protein
MLPPSSNLLDPGLVTDGPEPGWDARVGVFSIGTFEGAGSEAGNFIGVGATPDKRLQAIKKTISMDRRIGKWDFMTATPLWC